MTAAQLLDEGVSILVQNPHLNTVKNCMNLRIAASLKWQEEEIGGLEYLQFARRNNTPIVPIGDVCHPLELLKRGYIDGKGWPKTTVEEPVIKLHRWFEGNHWYPFVDGKEVIENGVHKWNTAKLAEDAAKRYIKNNSCNS